MYEAILGGKALVWTVGRFPNLIQQECSFSQINDNALLG